VFKQGRLLLSKELCQCEQSLHGGFRGGAQRVFCDHKTVLGVILSMNNCFYLYIRIQQDGISLFMKRKKKEIHGKKEIGLYMQE
jgi:hypothetical protein